MFPQVVFSLIVWLCAGTALTSPVSEIGPDAALSCGETAALVCFGVDGSTSQDVEPADVAYAASYLRGIAKSNAGTAGAFWNSTCDISVSTFHTFQYFLVLNPIRHQRKCNLATQLPIDHLDLMSLFPLFFSPLFYSPG